ncbi:MAG: diguanylate cyclase [Alphaproteobacteria bacterium]
MIEAHILGYEAKLDPSDDMTRLANVLLAHDIEGDNKGGNDDLLALLADNNYHVIACPSGEELLEEARQGLPDLAVIDLKSTGFDALGLAHDLIHMPEAAGIAVVLFNADGGPDGLRHAIDAAVDDIFPDSITAVEILARLKPLLRLATLRRETIQRRALAIGCGLRLDDTDANTKAPAPFKLLHIGQKPEVFESIKASIGDPCQITSAPDSVAADIILGGDGFYDACFMILGDDAPDCDEALDFCTRSRLNSRLFNLPVLLVLQPGHSLDISRALAAGATQVVELDDQASALSTGLILHARRQQGRWQMSRALAQTKGPQTTDPRTGAYTFDFMKARLTTLLEAARIREKHLTLVFFSFPDAHTIGEQFGQGAADHLLRQLSAWISAMVRTEDMIAHYTGHDFCIALPDTPVDEALYVMNRISGVLTYTDFALDEVYQPVTISVEFGLADNAPGDSTEMLIQRARRHLD